RGDWTLRRTVRDPEAPINRVNGESRMKSGVWRPRTRAPRRGSREDAALLVAVLQALQTDRVAGGAPVGLVRDRVLANVGVGRLHAALEAAEDVGELPLLGALVLQPLVV